MTAPIQPSRTGLGGSPTGVFSERVAGELIIAIVYIDDAMFFGKNLKVVKKAKQTFMDMWECQELSKAKEFLRMRIWHQGQKILLDQSDYLKKVVERFGMSNMKGATTPLPAGYVPLKSDSKCSDVFRSTYQSIIGSLLYIMLGTHPNITYAVTKLAQFSVNPS